ncbi:hypothetical protein CBL_01812 [Carabus blaptoides fortunei]
MKNNEGDTIDEISEYAISFQSPANPAYNYVINTDPDLYGNTRTFFIKPPEIIYRNKDHIAEKQKYITCSFSSQYHKSYSELPDGNIEIKIVKNSKKPETGKQLKNCIDEKMVTEQIIRKKPTSIIDLTMNPNRARHEVVKKDKPFVEEIPIDEKLWNDYGTSYETTQRETLFSDFHNENERVSKKKFKENLQQPYDLNTQSISGETRENNAHISTINEDIEPLPLRRIAGVFFNDSNKEFNGEEYCFIFNNQITAIQCPLNITSLPRVNESQLQESADIHYLDITPDNTDENKLVVIGKQQCYLLEIMNKIECPDDRSNMLMINETGKKEIPNTANRKMIAEQYDVSESIEDEEYSSVEQSIETSETYYSIISPKETIMYPEIYTTTNLPVQLLTEIYTTEKTSADPFLVRMIKFNTFKDENKAIEKCLEIDSHISVTNCPSEVSVLPIINETILSYTGIFNHIQDIPDLDDNKLLVRGDTLCYILNKINEITCPIDESELVTILVMDRREPTTTISATTQESFKSQPETLTENNPTPEIFMLRFAKVKIDNSGENYSLKVICKYIDRNIRELNCPTEISDIPYFNEHLFPEYVESYHINKLPELTDNTLLFRGNKNCYILSVVTMTKCPTNTTKLLTLSILEPDESKLQHTTSKKKYISQKTDDSNESDYESDEDCDYVSTEEEIKDKTISTTTISNESKHFLVRFIDIISFDKIEISCYNVDKCISLVNCPENKDEIPEFDVQHLPNDTVISDEVSEQIVLNKNQMIAKGKGRCYILTKFDVEKCPTDGQKRMLNVIDCKIDSESLDTKPINNLANLLNSNIPIALEITHISERSDIPTYTTVTCENVSNNISIGNCPSGFFKIYIINENLLSKYPKDMHRNMPEYNDNMLMAQGERDCYIFEKNGKIDCPEDLQNIVRLITHDVIDNEEYRSSTKYSPNFETVTNQFYETTTEVTSTPRETTEEANENNIFPVALQVLHISPQLNIPSYLTTTCKNINRTIVFVNCHTGFQQIPIINDKLLLKYANQIIQRNISELSDSMLMVRGNKYCYDLDQVGTCVLINSSIAIIDCPTGIRHIPRINDQKLSTYAKEIIYKNISEFSDNMLVVRGKKDCYLLDRIGPTNACWEHEDDIMNIFTKQVIKDKELRTARNDLKNNETAKIISKDQITSTIADTLSSQNISTPIHSYTYESVTTEKTESDDNSKVHNEVSSDDNSPVRDHRLPKDIFQYKIRGNRRFDFNPEYNDIIYKSKRSRFPVKIVNTLSPNSTSMICKYVDKKVQYINTSEDIFDLPYIIDAQFPTDVQLERKKEMPDKTDDKHLFVQGLFGYYLLKVHDTFQCPENTDNFALITINYKIRDAHNVSVPIPRINRNKAKTTAKIFQYPHKFSFIMTFIGTGYNDTTCAYVEEYMTVIDGKRKPTKLRIDKLPKARYYYDERAPLEMNEFKLGMRARGVWYIYNGYEEFACPNDTEIFMRQEVFYPKNEVLHFPAMIGNIPKPHVVKFTCKLMEITELDSPLELGEVPYIELEQLPDNVIIKYSKYDPSMIDDKSILVQYHFTYYILKEYKTIECPKNTDDFLLVIIPAEKNWFFKSNGDKPPYYKRLAADIDIRSARLIHKIKTNDNPAISETFKPENVNEELSVIPLVSRKDDQQMKNKRKIEIYTKKNPRSQAKQAVISITPKSSVTNLISKSTEEPLLPSPAYLNSVVVKHNNIENKEECYEVNNHMHVNKISCPDDTSRIPKVINPEFIKLLCPKKLRPKLKYMTGLGILRKLNMIIHEPNKQKSHL